MAQTCTICIHPEREEIESALVRGEPTRRIAARIEGISAAALQRHKHTHLPEALGALHRERESERSASLLEEVRGLQQDAVEILEAAKAADRPTIALNAIREASRLLELCGKLTGELDDRPQQVVNVLVSGEWHQVRAALFEALGPYPEARLAVARRLEALEPGG